MHPAAEAAGAARVDVGIDPYTPCRGFIHVNRRHLVSIEAAPVDFFYFFF